MTEFFSVFFYAWISMEKGGSMDDLKKLEGLLNKLKKNRENIPEELLKTKYAKAYKALLEEIKLCAEGILKRPLKQMSLKLDGQGLQLAYEIDNLLLSKGYCEQISQSLFKFMDISLFQSIMEEMFKEIKKMYLEYKEKCNKEAAA